jgi:hypothetical protein
VDTALESPRDISRWNEAPHVLTPRYRAEPRSTVFLFTASI